MLTHLIASFFCVYSLISELPEKVKATQSAKIQGSCLNAVTKERLKSSAYVLYRQNKVKIGESDATGRFNLIVPVSTEAIIFEADGFAASTIPVKFNQGISENARFRLTIELSTRDWLATAVANQLCLNFDAPADLEVNYKVTPVDSKEAAVSLNVKPELNRQPLTNLNIDTVKPGKSYLVTATSASGQLLFTNTVKINPGANFLAVIINSPATPHVATASTKPVAPIAPVLMPTPAIGPVKTTSPTAIYFDQSSYDLRETAKVLLDSVSTILLQQPAIRLNVTGYTDNIGRHDLNVILSEYRARTVANYLKQKGVRPDQLVISGKGPDSFATSDDPEDNRLKNRRVIIQLLPR